MRTFAVAALMESKMRDGSKGMSALQPLRIPMAMLALIPALTLASCNRPKDWQGWVYPNRNNLTDDIPIGSFETFAQCSATAKALVIRFESERDDQGNWTRGDYECGFKCKPTGRRGALNICEKTER